MRIPRRFRNQALVRGLNSNSRLGWGSGSEAGSGPASYPAATPPVPPCALTGGARMGGGGGVDGGDGPEEAARASPSAGAAASASAIRTSQVTTAAKPSALAPVAKPTGSAERAPVRGICSSTGRVECSAVVDHPRRRRPGPEPKDGGRSPSSSNPVAA